uniref:Muscle-specific beta 1 integrin binding protein 2 n=1 Tax=Seriola dumerili TaxID=41447 RepID=A0A3B4UAA9_SERDU
MKYIIGIGGVTNGGKTTLTNRLIKNLPNCCVVHQDDFFKSLLCPYYYYYSQRTAEIHIYRLLALGNVYIVV